MRLRELLGDRYWHGSLIPDLKELLPRESPILGRKAVFAATYPEVAVAMSGHWTDDDFKFGRNVSSHQDADKVPYTLQELWDGAIDEFFNDPVYVYEVNSQGFWSNGKIQDFEVVSYRPVEVQNMEKVSDPIKFLFDSTMVRVKRFGQ